MSIHWTNTWQRLTWKRPPRCGASCRTTKARPIPCCTTPRVTLSLSGHLSFSRSRVKYSRLAAISPKPQKPGNGYSTNTLEPMELTQLCSRLVLSITAYSDMKTRAWSFSVCWYWQPLRKTGLRRVSGSPSAWRLRVKMNKRSLIISRQRKLTLPGITAFEAGKRTLVRPRSRASITVISR